MYTSPILLLLVSIVRLLRRIFFCEDAINFSKTAGLEDLKGSPQPWQYVNLSWRSQPAPDFLSVREVRVWVWDQGVCRGCWPPEASGFPGCLAWSPTLRAGAGGGARRGSRLLWSRWRDSQLGDPTWVQGSPMWKCFGFHLHDLWPDPGTIFYVRYVKQLYGGTMFKSYIAPIWSMKFNGF